MPDVTHCNKVMQSQINFRIANGGGIVCDVVVGRVWGMSEDTSPVRYRDDIRIV